MTLNVSDLADSLTDLFEGTDGYPASDAEAGQRWAGIYRAYASAALAGPTAPLAASLQEAGARLARALAAAFTAAKASDAGIATLTTLADVAFVDFWLGKPPDAPPVTFTTPPPPPPAVAGLVTVATAGVVSPGLSDVLTAAGAMSATAAQQAQSIATVLDDWTRTVQVVNTPLIPPGPPENPVALT